MALDQLPPDGTVPAPCDPDAVVPGRSRRFDRWVVWTALGLSLLPFAVAAAVLAASAGDVRPVGDLALTELRVRDVPSHLPLTGPYSRDGWHHPGPALFYLLAPLYWLAGGASVSLWVGALLVNGASIGGMGLIARHRGGIAAMLCVLGACALLVRALGFGFLGIPWNPYVTVLPYGLLVVLTWAMLCGDRWALPLGAGVATFLAQTHVGNVVLALPLLAVGAAGLVLADRAAGPSPRRSWRALALAVAVGAVAWLPTAVDQLTSEPGNLGEILTWFRASGARAHTLVEGWNVVSAQFWLAPEWLRGERPVDVVPRYLDHPLVPLLLVVVAAAAVAAWRRRAATSERRLFVAWAVASVLGVVSVARTVDEVFGYRLRWSWMLAAIAAAASGWVAWTAAVRRRPASERRVLVPVALVGLASLAAVNSVAAVREGAPQDEASTVIAALMPQLLDALPPGDGPVVVGAAGLRGLSFRNGVLLDLERRGIDARVSSSDAVGGHRAHDGGPVRATLTVVADSQILSFHDRDGWDQVAYAGPAPLAAVTDELARQQDVVERFERGELALDEAYRELESTLRGGSVVAVFLRGVAGR